MLKDAANPSSFGYAPAKLALAQIFHLGLHGIKENSEKAIYYYKSAIDSYINVSLKGYALYSLAHLYKNLIDHYYTVNDYKQAADYYKQAIDCYKQAISYGNDQAACELAYLCLYTTTFYPNINIPTDPQQVAELFLNAASNGAQYAIGQFFKYGIGEIKHNIDIAKLWLFAAAKQNHPEAIQDLKELEQWCHTNMPKRALRYA